MAIFMIGTQRSGSNLLRLMLNQLPGIAAPHPPHILQRMTPLLAAYGDLDHDVNYFSLIEDVCRLVELNPVPWEGVSFDREQIARAANARSFSPGQHPPRLRQSPAQPQPLRTAGQEQPPGSPRRAAC